jgi:hypothetical protein
MTTFETPLSGGLVLAGQTTFRLSARLSEPVTGWSITWFHQNESVTTGVGSQGQDLWCELATVEASHAGNWEVRASKDSESVTSSTRLLVLESGAIERPLVWRKPFARGAGIFLSIVFALFVAVTGARAVQLIKPDPEAGKTDTALLVLLLALIGIGMLLVAAFMALVDLRGRASEATTPPVDVLDVSGADVATVIDALGKLRGINLVAVGGLLCLAGAAVLGWHLT